MIIMSSCANKFVEDRNRKHTFVQASKVLVETVNRIYKSKGCFLIRKHLFIVKIEY